MAAAALETATKELNQQIGLSGDGSQFLTFNLGEELYGVDILRVQEIKGYTTVTKIPNTPSHIKGVLNLRGTIVPIIELRTKFNMPTIDYTAFTVIIVVVVRDKVMGLVVDAVSDVLNIDKKDIQPAPQFGAKVDVSFLNGIGKSGDKLVALLDMDRLLLDDEMLDGAKAA
ncbi:MAG: chemotaxis protein CheW [Nitrospira sp.]|nr:chemotaxis protein CheW [Nitrospira sp.]MBX3332631.1 chemotaxis protein CheW [Nitrospira sp.]